MKVLSKMRLRPSEKKYDDFPSISLSDHARYIYSASFRRLQMKAQVFSLENNAAVRSRLTHSMEVAHIGVFLVQKIVELISEELSKGKAINPYLKFILDENVAIRKTVETACLIHDVGNPPFGHFGESAISTWFGENKAILEDKKKVNLSESDYNYNDFIHFDGNPQGLRIISKLQGTDAFGLNLTTSQLAACIKYVASNDTVGSNKLHHKKMGYFSTEEKVVSAIKTDLGISGRHILAYLMEAADDISYCISDIEDGFEKGIVSYELFFKYIKKSIYDFCERDRDVGAVYSELPKLRSHIEDAEYIISKYNENFNDCTEELEYKFLLFKTTLTNLSVKLVAFDFFVKFDDYLNGNVDALIREHTLVYDLQEILKDFTRKYIFTSAEAERMELGGYAIIYGLLDKFSPLLELSRDDFIKIVEKKAGKKMAICTRLFNLLSDKHVRAYVRSLHEGVCDKVEFNLRCHLITDYIAGMTDSFSLETYQLLNGIKVG
ncbi:Deoxyguanosinetriphosphate triphosphohydrolase [compost metagenome]